MNNVVDGAMQDPAVAPAQQAAAEAHADPPRAPAARAAGVSWRRGAPVWLILGFFAAYALAEGMALFPHARFNVQPWNLHPALGVALIVFAGPTYVPAIFVAILAGWWLAPGGYVDGGSVVAALGIAATYWAAGSALHRWARWGTMEVRPRDVHVLLAIGAATAVLDALIDGMRQAASLGLAADALPLLAWRIFVANLLGIVVLTPALLQWAGGAWRAALQRARPRVLVRDAVLFAAVQGSLLALVFGLHLLDQFRASYLLFLPMIAVAMRHGLIGVATTIPFLQLGLLEALTLIGSRAGTAFEFQLLVFTLAVSSLYLGALADERSRAARRIAEHERALREGGRALAEAQRVAATAELAAALAHDLSQPLSAIGTYARACQVLAGRGPVERVQLGQTLEQIATESTRAGNYLRRMREFFRTGTMRQERVELPALIHQARAHLRERLILGDIQWRVSLEPGLPAARADAVQVGAILGNLLANACDALGPEVAWRQIHVRARRVPDSNPPMVRIHVEDSGAGIAPEVRTRLFSPLATSKAQGMGLGLALSRTIAGRLGGRLWLDESSPATTFCLDLPVYDDAA